MVSAMSEAEVQNWLAILNDCRDLEAERGTCQALARLLQLHRRRLSALEARITRAAVDLDPAPPWALLLQRRRSGS